MRHRRPTYTHLHLGLFSVAAAGFFTLFCAKTQAQTTYIYSESNGSQEPLGNTIYALRNDGLGNLTPLAGSPYPTGGLGVHAMGGSEFNADQEVITNEAGSLLYAVNGHSNSVSGFAINADGTLTPLRHSPYPSGGQDPVSIGLAGNFLVVANKNEDPNQNIGGDVPNYTSFTVAPNGNLRMNAGSTVDLAPGSSPSQAMTWDKGHVVFGLELFTSRIASYSFDRNGIMTEVGSIAPPTETDAFLGEVLHPTQRVLYAGLLHTNQLGVYKFNSAGVLTFVRAAPNDGSDICWFKTNAAGTRLYSSESVSRTVTVYDITQSLNPVQLEQITLSGADFPLTNIALDPTEQFFYALSGHNLHILNIDSDGLLTETLPSVLLPGSPLERPLGLAVVRK
jgi:6-phosphogluconolactonase (cycloisomerase 2 family)